MKKLLSFTLCSLLIMSLVTGAALAESGLPADPKELTGKCVIWEFNVNPYKEHLQPDFNAIYPNVELEVLNAGESADVIQKLLVSLSAETDIPDVIPLEIGVRGALLKTGVLQDLEEEPYGIDRNAVLDWQLPLVTDADGKIVCIEACPTPAGFLYDKNLTLQYFGTSDPDELVAMFPDWDTFVGKLSEVVKESNGEIIPFASISDLSAAYEGQFTEPYVAPDGTLNVRERFLNALTFEKKAYDAGIIGKIDGWSPAWYAQMASGKTMFFPCAPWFPVNILMPNDPEGVNKWGFMATPGGSMYTWGGTGFAIPKAAPNKLNGWAFVNWRYDGMKGAQYNYDNFGDISWLKEPYETPDFYSKPFAPEYFGDVNIIEKMAANINNVKTRALSEFDMALGDPIAAARNKVITGGVSVEDAVTQLEADILTLNPRIKPQS